MQTLAIQSPERLPDSESSPYDSKYDQIARPDVALMALGGLVASRLVILTEGEYLSCRAANST
jgi:hypothetical protein